MLFLISSTIISFYLLEAVLRFGLKYNTISLLEFYTKKKNDYHNATVRIAPIIFVNDNSYDIQPLSGVSNSMTIVCNENGYYKVYNSDKHGFANSNEVWSEKIIDFVIIGDSHAQGECVQEKDTISGHLRKEQNTVLNLAMGGNGPLLSLATLVEYIPHVNAKNILYIFNDTDFEDLNRELENDILKKYLLQKNYSQNLFFKQDKIDIFLKNYFDYNFNIFFSKAEQGTLLNFVKLASLRNLMTSKISILQNRYKAAENIKINDLSLPNYDYIESLLIFAKNISLKNNSKLYFIYVPTYRHFFTDKSQEKNRIIEIAKKLDIETIDLSNFIIKNYKLENIYSVTLKGFGHPNEKGYQIISNEIIKNIKNNND
jgi:hypothetical protein